MADLDVSYDKIQAAADKVATIKTDLEASLARSRKHVDTLTTSGFQTATASTEYETQFTNIPTNTEAAIKELDGIEQFLQGVIKTFSDTDSSLAKPMAN